MTEPITLSLLAYLALSGAVGHAGGLSLDKLLQVPDAIDDMRRKAFNDACEQAKRKLLENTSQTGVPRRLLDALEWAGANEWGEGGWRENFSTALDAMLQAGEVDLTELVRLSRVALQRINDHSITDVQLSETLRTYCDYLRTALFEQDVYRDLQLQRATWRSLQGPEYDTLAQYLDQVAERHQYLEFAGIPAAGLSRTPGLQQVYIQLRAQARPRRREPRAAVQSDGEGEGPPDVEALPIQEPTLTLADVLDRERHLVVLGEPGSGKTTLLRAVTHAFALSNPYWIGLDEHCLPVYVSLPDFAQRRGQPAAPALEDYLTEKARNDLGAKVADDFFRSALVAGRCCVCLDGLDEVGDSLQRRQMTDLIGSFVNRFPDNRYILSSRPAGYDTAGVRRESFAHYVLQPFTSDQTLDFLQRWYATQGLLPGEALARATELAQAIADPTHSGRLQVLASNPLLLTLMALIHEPGVPLPRSRAALYENCIDTLLKLRDAAQGRQRRAIRDGYPTRRLLEQIAYWMQARVPSGGQANQVRSGDLLAFIAEVLNTKGALSQDVADEEAREFLEDERGRGLLVERGKDAFGFVHLAFQESLVAADIRTRCARKGVDAIWGEIQPYLHHAHWREVVLLLLGSLEDYEGLTEAVLERILEAGKEDKYEPVLHRHLFLVAAAIADGLVTGVSPETKQVEELLALAASDEPAWQDAIELLGQMAGNSQASAGLELLARNARGQTGYWTTRCLRAAGSLWRWGEKRLAQEILVSYAEEGSRRPVNFLLLADSLHECGEVVWAAQLVQESAEACPSAEYRVDMLATLWKYGRKEVALRMLEEIADDESADETNRRAAAETMGELGEVDRAVSLLRGLTHSDFSEYVQLHAAISIGKLGRFEEANEVLRDIGWDNYWGVQTRIYAAKAMSDFHDSQGAVKLLEALVTSDGARPGELVQIVNLLWGQGWGGDAVGILRELLTKTKASDFEQVVIGETLGKLGDQAAALKCLRDGLQNSGDNVHRRLHIATALADLGHSDESLRLFCELTTGPPFPAPVLTAAQYISRIAPPEIAAEALLRWTTDPSLGPGNRFDVYGMLKAFLSSTPINGSI